jgi:hypothetical protein
MGRSAENHYRTSELDVLKALRVPAAANCALALRAIACIQPQALEVLNAWGFTYRTHAILEPQDCCVGSIPVNDINAGKRLCPIDSLRLKVITERLSAKQNAALVWSYPVPTDVSGGLA